MNAICVDDEAILLEVLKRAVEESPDVEKVICFSDAESALEWADVNLFDIAFLDIQLHQMDGVTLAKKLIELQPNVKIIFCTGYESYAVDAFKIHAAGYLTKPIYAEDVQEQIDYIKSFKAPDSANVPAKLTAKCFGDFEIYMNGKQLEFKRRKAKELFAYLIDRKGAEVSFGQMSAILWEEEYDEQKHRNNLYQLIHHLKAVLTEIGMENVLVKLPNGYAVDTSLIDCDYYDYLSGKTELTDRYIGEYMYQYSWAESTGALLDQMI